MQLLNNGLQEYALTPDEEQAAVCLSTTQRARLQNLRVAAIKEKFTLSPELHVAGGADTYLQQEAYLRGRVQLIDELLEADDTAKAQQIENTPN